MSKLIALPDGHGMNTPGKRTPILPAGLKSETGNFMHENEFNRAVVKYLDEDLRRCGFRTLLLAPTDEDTPLPERARKANEAGADICVEIHANAVGSTWGSAEGVETYAGPSSNSKRLAACIHKNLIQGTQQKNRGVRDGSWLYMAKHTNMPYALVEAGFMDNLNEAKLLLSDAFRREVAKEIAKGICEYFGVPYVEGSPIKEVAGVTYTDTQPPQNWRLQTGAFSDVATAEKMHSKFDDAFPELAKYSRVEGLRIVTGSWPSAATAEEYKTKIKQKFGWWIYIKEA